MRGRLGLALAVLALGGCRSELEGALAVAKVERAQLAPGVELVRASLKRGHTPGGRAHLVFATPEAVTLEIELNPERSPLAKLGGDALLTMNAAFFTPSYTPTGLLVSKGRQLHPFVREAGGAGSGVVLETEAGVEMLERDEVKARDLGAARWAIQAGPRIIERGGVPGIRADDRVRAHRSFLGKDHRGRLVLGVVLGPSGFGSGPSLHELQQLLLDEALMEHRLDFALNLDGGPSTGLYLRHPEHPLVEPEGAAVYSYLLLRLAE